MTRILRIRIRIRVGIKSGHTLQRRKLGASGRTRTRRVGDGGIKRDKWMDKWVDKWRDKHWQTRDRRRTNGWTNRATKETPRNTNKRLAEDSIQKRHPRSATQHREQCERRDEKIGENRRATGSTFYCRSRRRTADDGGKGGGGVNSCRRDWYAVGWSKFNVDMKPLILCSEASVSKSPNVQKSKRPNAQTYERTNERRLGLGIGRLSVCRFGLDLDLENPSDVRKSTSKSKVNMHMKPRYEALIPRRQGRYLLERLARSAHLLILACLRCQGNQSRSGGRGVGLARMMATGILESWNQEGATAVSTKLC